MCFKEVCKSDLRVLNVDTHRWEENAVDRSQWRQELNKGLDESGEAPVTCRSEASPEEEQSGLNPDRNGHQV